MSKSDTMTDEEMADLRAKLLAHVQAQQQQQQQQQPQPAQQPSANRPAQPSGGNVANNGTATQPKQSTGLVKGIAIGAVSVATLVAAWFGFTKDKTGSAKSEPDEVDAALNNKPAITQTIQNEQEQPADVAEVDLPQTGASQQQEPETITPTPEPEPKTPEVVTPAPAPEPVPLTRDELIQQALLARDARVQTLLAKGDFKGAEKAMKEVEQYIRSLKGEPTIDDAKTLVKDATTLARGAVDISGSAVRLTEDQRKIADLQARATQVDPAKRDAEVAGYRASAAKSRRAEVAATADADYIEAEGETAGVRGAIDGAFETVESLTGVNLRREIGKHAGKAVDRGLGRVFGNTGGRK